jgi:hypothetical protein
VTEELARHLDAGMTTTREPMATFHNDLNNERLTRWVLALRVVRPMASSITWAGRYSSIQPPVIVSRPHTSDPRDLAGLPDSCRC